MLDTARKTLFAAAAVGAMALAGQSAQAAVVNDINDGDIINTIAKNELYRFEDTFSGSEGAGFYSFTFIAAAEDAPLPVISVTANLFGALGGTLNGAYLSWSNSDGVLSQVDLGDIVFGGTVWGAGEVLKTVFTQPDNLTQTLKLGWTSRSGDIQYSLNVAAVPLPAGGLLLLGALGGLAVLRRRGTAA